MAKNSVKGRLVVIGGSAGSLHILLQILTDLKTDLRVPVIIILHRKNDSESSLGQLMAMRTQLQVKEADDKEPIVPGTVYLAPANYHLLVEQDNHFSLDASEKINFSRPSIDVTFQTAADAYTNAVTGILLSGANADGVEGLRLIQRMRGTIIVQDPATAQVPFMPQAALDELTVDHIFNTAQISAYINAL